MLVTCYGCEYFYGDGWQLFMYFLYVVGFQGESSDGGRSR